MEPHAPTEAGTVIPFTPRPTPPPTPATPGKKRATKKTQKQVLAAKIAKAGTAIDVLYAAIQEMTDERAAEFTHYLTPLMDLVRATADGFQADAEVGTVQ